MKTLIARLVMPFALFAVSSGAMAQALTYVDCEVEDAPSVVAAITRLYDSMEGGARPTIFLDQWIWNGEDPSTHRIVVAYPDYAALEAFRGRVGGTAAQLAIGNTLDVVADCNTNGLAVLRGQWGNQEAPAAAYYAVYGISATDGPAYAAALERLATSQATTAPGSILLFENRAGIRGDTHLVVIGAPTLAGLNEYLDTLYASDEFADFTDDVSDIRTVTWRNQAFRVRAWTSPAN
jgi:hypothetical protein